MTLPLRPLVRSLPFIALALVAGSCGGGGGGGGSLEVTGLMPPDQISVVTPSGDEALPVEPDFPLDSDYHQDVARRHVYDPAIEPLNTVNMILCLIEQTAADELVNEPAYLAQVNTTKCEQGGGESETGQSAGAVDEFQLWAVESSRASDTEPQEVAYWVPENDDGHEMTIFVDGEITAGVDAEHPFGEFALDFAGAEDVAGLESPLMGGALTAGTLESGHAGFQFYFRKGDLSAVPAVGEHAEETTATLFTSADQQSGTARIRRQERMDFGSGDTGVLTAEYLIAYDAGTFLRALDGGAPEAFHRDQFIESVWQYNLYHASGENAGQRVELDSGFGFKTQAGERGWIGYWGLWAPPGVEVADGDVVTSDAYGEEPETYTVFRAPGRLIQNTRRTLNLDELDGHTFQWWHFDGSAGTNYVVAYDENSLSWLKIGTQDPGQPTMTPIDPPEAIDTAGLGFLNMWSASLGGPTAYVHGEDAITYYAQSFVTGADELFTGGELELYGFVQCLRPGITASEAEAGDVYLADAPDVASPHLYTFQQSDLTLYLDTTGTGGGLDVAGLAPGEMPSSGPYTWGMRSGPMVTSSAGLASPWDVWNQDVFYVWETGANDWNQFTGVLDTGGQFVSFDAPLAFNFTLAAGDDRNGDDSRAGQTFVLSYGGPGQLWGLPSDGIDLTGDDQPDRWYPLVNLADGVLVGPNGSEYVVKALEMEQRLAPDAGYSGALDLDSAATLVLPTSALFTTPDIGPRPEITDAPRVVDGVVVE